MASFLVDGGWSDWNLIGNCSGTCGDGQQSKVRTCTNPSKAGSGADCVGSSTGQGICTTGIPCIGSTILDLPQQNMHLGFVVSFCFILPICLEGVL